MSTWHGYILISRPAALSLADWRKALAALYVQLNRRADDPQPSRRLHSRLSRDKTRVIIEAAFETTDLTADKLAGIIANALEGKYTVAQIKTALSNNVTLWQAGKARRLSGDAARAYLKANAAEWES